MTSYFESNFIKLMCINVTFHFVKAQALSSPCSSSLQEVFAFRAFQNYGKKRGKKEDPTSPHLLHLLVVNDGY